jgi:hypothetical protein
MALGRNCERVSGIALGDIRLIVALPETLEVMVYNSSLSPPKLLNLNIYIPSLTD